MTLLIESQYLPPIHTFARMLYHGKVMIEQYEYFEKATYRNRCEVATPNGRFKMSIPLQKGRNQMHTVMKDLPISYHHTWQRQHWHTLTAAYRSSPYFEYYEDDLQPFYEQEISSLLDFNQQLLLQILRFLNADIAISQTRHFEKNYASTDILDFRSAIHPNAAKAKPDPLFTPPTYTQVFDDRMGFLPNLSIIDLLFAEGPNAENLLRKAMK